MKNLLCLVASLCVVFYASAQRLDASTISKLPSAQQIQVNHYVAQAEKARRTGLFMSIGGGGLATVGVILALTATHMYSYDYQTTAADDARANAGGVLVLAGAASSLGSIPFFIKMRKKRTAARAIIREYRKASQSTLLVRPLQGSSLQFGLAVSIP